MYVRMQSANNFNREVPPANLNQEGPTSSVTLVTLKYQVRMEYPLCMESLSNMVCPHNWVDP